MSKVEKPYLDVLVNGWTYNSALAAVLPSATPFVDLEASGRAVLTCLSEPEVRLFFAGTDADNETFGYQVYGVRTARGSAVSIPVKIAAGVVTLGNIAATAIAVNGFLADTITQTMDCTDVEVVHPAGDAPAYLRVNTSQWNQLVVGVSRDGLTAAKMYVFAARTGIAGGTVTEASAADIKTGVSTLKAATDLLAASGGGGFIRQDSTATIAKESGGNLAAISGGGYTIKMAIFNDKATTEDLIALVAGKKIAVVGGIITLGGADGTVTIASNATPISAAFKLLVGGALNVLPRPMTRPMWQTAAGEALKVIITGGGTISGQLEYIEV